MSFACWLPSIDHPKAAQAVIETSKQVVYFYKQLIIGTFHTVLVIGDGSNTSDIALILQCAASPLWSVFAPHSTQADSTYAIDGQLFGIDKINSQQPDTTAQSLAAGDILLLKPLPPIKAGGHHQQDTSIVLPADATFTQRAEFAVNTHGWLAADEMVFIGQILHWTPLNGPKHSMPVYWDPDKSEFDETFFGPPDVCPDATTILPVPVNNHLRALEIIRAADTVSVVTVQVPEHLHTRIILILARFLDFKPHRMHIEHVQDEHVPHLCGWHLLYRWICAQGLQDTIAATEDQPVTQQELRDQIELVLQSSIQDWLQAEAEQPVWTLAARLRRHFFSALARRLLRQGNINQQALTSAFPAHTRAPLGLVPQIPFVAYCQEIIDRIATRLSSYEAHPEWATSDELDFALEAPRSLQSATLFCALAVWHAQSESLYYLNALPPNLQVYNHIVAD